MKIIQFELNTPIKYAPGSGEEIDATHIDLKEPTGKVSHICCDIEAAIQSGVLKMSSIIGEEAIADAKEQAASKDKDEESKIDVDSILSVMTSGGVDMNKVVLHFRELFKQVAFIGGEKPMTSPHMDRMSHSDFRRMMGTYAANFILNS